MRLLFPLLLAFALLAPGLNLETPSARAQTASVTSKIAPPLLSRMAADPARLQPVIVEMQHAGAPFGAQTDAQLAQQALSLIGAYGGIQVGGLPIVDSAAGWLNATGIQALSGLTAVAYIHDDSTVQPQPAAAGGVTWPPGALASLYPRETHATTIWPQDQGAGVTVAVLDSGIAADPDIGNRLVASVNLADNRSTPDPGGHGTHVAGIAVGDGSKSGGQYVGMAPAANVVDVRVIDSLGNGRISSVVAGIGWVMAHRAQYNIRVINLSFGAPAPPSYHTDPLSAAIEIAWKRGIVVVVAAGNGGPSSGTVQTPGIDPYVITVGAVDDQGTLTLADDLLAWFSAWGTPTGGQPKPDLVAPGRKIVSLRVPGSYLDAMMPSHVVTAWNGTTYFRMSGTSQATPVVSGAVALMLSRMPALTPDQVKAILLATTQGYGGASMLPDGSADGAGLLDAAAAVLSGLRGSANGGLRPSDGLARTLYPWLYGQPLVWKDSGYDGLAWNLLGWATLSWDNIAWDNIAWDSFNWSNIAWDNIAWDNIAWDNIAWDQAGWDNIAWDNIAWD